MDKTIILIIIMCICISISISVAGGIGFYFTQIETTSPPTTRSSSTTRSPIPTTPAPTTTTGSPTTTRAPTTTTPTPKVFKRTGTTTPGAGGSFADNNFDLVCPEGSYVNQFTTLWGSTINTKWGQSGELIDKIGIRCSDNTIRTPQGGFGGGVGTAAYTTNVESTTGFGKLDVKSGSFLDSITFYPFNNSTGTSVGGTWGDPQPSLSCGTGEKIMGVSVNAGQYTNRINIICGKEQ